MTTYVITAPDGNEYEVDAPEGATQEHALKYFQANWKAESPQQKAAPAPQQEQSILNQYILNPANEIAGTIFDPVLQMATGFAAKPISEVMGMSAAAQEMVNPQGGDPEKFKQDIAESLTYEPRTSGGKFVSQNILAPIGSALEYGVEAITPYATSALGVLPLVGSDNKIAQSGTKEALMQSLNFIGAKGAPKVTSAIKESNLAKLAALKEQQGLASLTNKISLLGP